MLHKQNIPHSKILFFRLCFQVCLSLRSPSLFTFLVLLLSHHLNCLSCCRCASLLSFTSFSIYLYISVCLSFSLSHCLHLCVCVYIYIYGDALVKMRRLWPFRLGTKLGFSIAPRFKVVNLLGFRVRSLSKVYH